MSIIAEILLQAAGAAIETAIDSRSRRLRWVAYAAIFVIVALILAFVMWALSE